MKFFRGENLLVICTHKTGVMLGSFQVSHVTEKKNLVFFICFFLLLSCDKYIVEVDTNYNDNRKMLQQLRRQQRLYGWMVYITKRARKLKMFSLKKM